MPSRIIPFVNDQIYHVYNRGSEKRRIFNNRRDYLRFLKTIAYYQITGPKPKFSRFYRSVFKLDYSKKIIDILAYCLMPNHIHLLAKQLKDGGITEFVGKTANSYTKYYNTKYDRVGHLFQGEFKAVLVEDDNQLMHVHRYIHLNPLVSSFVDNLEDYEWSSYKEFTQAFSGLCSKSEIMSFFKLPKNYKNFVLDQASYAKELEYIKHKVIEEI